MIKINNMNNCIIYRHIELSIEFNEEPELYKFVKKVVNNFHDVTVWTSNSFIVNDIGFWNSVISINVDGMSYCYMFRYNYNLKILYGCPCYYKKILPSFEHVSLSNRNNPSLFNLINKDLLNIIENLDQSNLGLKLINN
jgi:hypothetical protein